MSSHTNTSTVCIIKPGNQIADRRFSASGRTNDCCNWILRNFQIHIMKHLSSFLPFPVRKIYILKFDIIVCNLYLLSICINEGLFCQFIQMLQGVINDSQYMSTVCNRLQRTKHMEWQQNDNHHISKIQLSRKSQIKCSDHDTHTCCL